VFCGVAVENPDPLKVNDMDPIYLDFNATTPVDPRVTEAIYPYLKDHFGNPSSTHLYGSKTQLAVTEARKRVASMLGANAEEIIFTSGGSESNNMAIKGAAYALQDRGRHIITSKIEHPAVTEVCRFLERQGFRVTWLDVDEFGVIDLEQFEEALTEETTLITIMHSNNEVGTLQPISRIAKLAHNKGALVHTDCAQSIGKVPVNVDQLGVDLLTIAGHKLYAPKGVGALYIKTGTPLEKLVHGADHESNRRAGTENVPYIVGLGKACELVERSVEAESKRLRSLKDLLKSSIEAFAPNCKFNGHPEESLPNTVSVSFPGMEANTLLDELTEVAASAGAACHSDHIDISAVLQAMAVPEEYAMGTLRLSVGRTTTEKEIDRATSALKKVYDNLNSNDQERVLPTSNDEIRLTQYTHGLGCACKLRPQLLEKILKNIPTPNDPRILVGTDTSDDAAVFQISPDVAIVKSVDFFTPVVDDPYWFGKIAAANSLSDIYAMGAMPLFALNIVGFPSSRLPITVLEEILKGAKEICDEAGIGILGGHTIDDLEPKFGLVVTEQVHPKKLITNRGAKPGDTLLLTKPIGTGVLSTALKRRALKEVLIAPLLENMATLNRAGAEAMISSGANAVTDITGFGLLGHLLEMVRGSGVSALLRFESVPFLEGAKDLALAKIIPGGTENNFLYTQDSVNYPKSMSETERLLLNDAQTSGGLLISLSQESLARFNEVSTFPYWEIGEVTKEPTGQVTLL
jgi:cysteine desulfurase NifS/selenium donor protein